MRATIANYDRLYAVECYVVTQLIVCLVASIRPGEKNQKSTSTICETINLLIGVSVAKRFVDRLLDIQTKMR